MSEEQKPYKWELTAQAGMEGRQLVVDPRSHVSSVWSEHGHWNISVGEDGVNVEVENLSPEGLPQLVSQIESFFAYLGDPPKP